MLFILIFFQLNKMHKIISKNRKILFFFAYFLYNKVIHIIENALKPKNDF